jgi:hypothetical protein
MRIYFAASNNGDGSSSVHFFESKKCIDLLEEHDLEGYGGCEGGDWMDIDGSVTGINIETLEEVVDYLVDYGYIDEEDAERLKA